MPIYEYTCKSCNHKFEKLLRSIGQQDAKVPCPGCGSTRTVRTLSVFAVGAEQSRASSSTSTPGICDRCGGPGPCALD
ncbi:MAG TPA: zinc ribbon domain-containing protein [Tepidisphaeraceae bacterium]|nr:zinc ribbon domain-containing protein [Tepidisphaeraceae bacterium]